MSFAYVGLGSNESDPPAQLARALAELDALPRTRLVTRSSLYRSAPVGYAAQPEFLNAVALLDTALEPSCLLTELQAIEARHGRRRTFPNAPRPLDLDILLYNERIIDTPALRVPHPRMHQRAFVLRPLLEIAPGIAIPGLGPAEGLLAGCAGQSVKALDG